MEQKACQPDRASPIAAFPRTYAGPAGPDALVVSGG